MIIGQKDQFINGNPNQKNGGKSSKSIFSKTNYQCMVGGLEHDFFDFRYIGNVIIPSDELIFFRGIGIPPPFSSGNPNQNLMIWGYQYFRKHQKKVKLRGKIWEHPPKMEV